MRASTTRPVRLAMQRAGLVTASTVFGLCIVEMGLRIADVSPPDVPHTADVDRHRVDERVNPFGLRETWTTVPERRPGETRIAMLGDSFVFGEGVERTEAMPAVLQDVLTARTGHPYRVFNLGVSDNDTHQEAARYRVLEPLLRPDVLVLVAYLNDFTRVNPAYTLQEIYDAGGTPGFFSRNSYLVGNLYARLRLQRMRRRSIAYYRSSALAGMDVQFEPVGREIVSLRDRATAHGTRFVLVFFPWLYSLDHYPLDEIHAHLGEFAARNHIDLIDLLDVFRHHGDEELRVSAANEHPNARAHRIAAEVIARHLLAAP